MEESRRDLLTFNVPVMTNTNDITIREATPDEIGILRHFEQGVIEAERPFDPTLRKDDIRYYDLENLITSDQSYLVVAEADGRLVGSGYARIEEAKPWLKHRNYAYLGFMYVVPEYRGRGINARIIGELKDWALSQDIRELRLEVYSPNTAAIQAYKKVGFSEHMLEMRAEI